MQDEVQKREKKKERINTPNSSKAPVHGARTKKFKKIKTPIDQEVTAEFSFS
jgi:hypothetical protein